jgi:LysR family nitrogen assimilation transcriptional regulator
VAECGGFTSAAARLRIAQSALSRNIQSLETELGTSLFERSARGAVLSQSGRLLWEHAKSITAQVEQARAAILAQRTVLSGEVAIGTWSNMSRYIYGPLAQSFLAEFPQVNLKLREGQVYILLEGLQTGWIDLAIMVNSEPSTILHQEPLSHERVYLVGACDDSDMPRELTDVGDLRNLPLVLMHRPNGSRTTAEAEATARGFSLNIRHEVGSTAVVKDFVARGLGYGLLPHSSVVDQMRDGSLATTAIPGLSLTRLLVRRADQPPSPLISELSRHVHLIFEQLRSEGRLGPPPE